MDDPGRSSQSSTRELPSNDRTTWIRLGDRRQRRRPRSSFAGSTVLSRPPSSLWADMSKDFAFVFPTICTT